jgi:hypothetical protein
MHLAPPGSHRAFVVASWTLALVLMMGLAVGWRHYFKVVKQRQILMETSARAERARMPQNTQPPATAVVAAPGTTMPETSAMLLGGATPMKYDPGASLVPARSVVEVLPMVNAGSVLAEASAIIQKYNSTPNWQDRLKYVFEPERVRRLMEDYYEQQRGVDPVMGALMDQGRYRIDGTEIVLLTHRGARPDGKLEIALRRTASDRLVIDWESFVGYGEMSFKDLISSRSAKPVMIRALVKVDDYYNFEFSDSKKLLSIKLTSPDGDSFVNAYCERDSVMGKWLSEDLGTRPDDSLIKGYTLWVSFPENAQSDRCLNLIQIPAGRWLILPQGK